jgi:putative transposase
VGEDSCRPARSRPRSRRTRTYSFRRRLRQPIGQDDGKGGRKADEDIGYDGHKKVKGRKRHLLVDADGRVLKVFVSAADQNDRHGAKRLLAECKGDYPRLKKIWADGQYTGWLIGWAAETLGVRLEVVLRSDDVSGFEVLPRRWVVERTFAWLGRYKRLAKDYEFCPEHSEAMVYVAMTQMLLNRLAP